MAKKSNSERILELLAAIEKRVDEINEKAGKNYLSEEVYLEIDEYSQISIPEDVYLQMCDELGEDFFKFMGIT